MPISTLSAKNFKNLRYSHDISAAKIAPILQLKSPASITGIETGKSSPSYELLERYANLFAVSADWLMGRSEVIYTQASVLTAERIALAEVIKADPAESVSNFDSQYLNESERSEFYSLKVRANMVFLIYSQYLPLLYYLKLAETYQQENDGIFTILKKLKSPYLMSQYYENHLGEKERKLLDCFAKFMHRTLTEPVFDIDKYISEQTKKE